MVLKLSVYGCLCELSEFSINGINAHYNDFGDKFDAGCVDDDIIGNEDDDANYGCYDMIFEGKNSSPKILSKYNITQSEYNEIVLALTEKLSFGECGWCI